MNLMQCGRAVAAETFKFFVPFCEDGTIGEANYEQDILSGKYVEKYKYGLLLGKNKENVGNSEIFNSGIAVEKVSVQVCFTGIQKNMTVGLETVI